MTALADQRDQAVTGVAPPQLSEAVIREVWPSVAAYPGAASFARFTYRTIVLAPIGWLVLAPIYFKKLLGIVPGLSGLAVRYRLTNRRLMICNGLKPVADKEVALDQIKDVRLFKDDNSDFFVAGTLEVTDHADNVVLTLPGVAEAESVRYSILQAAAAWGPVLRGEKIVQDEKPRVTAGDDKK
jgi:hypothetical protein